MGATFLRGDLVGEDIRKWCLKHGREQGCRPLMAVIFFHTDEEAVHYVRIKANIAKKAGVEYAVYELPVHASNGDVKAQIHQLNIDDTIHGILMQRPLPEHLDELKIGSAIASRKHIEETIAGNPSNIAADALTRLLTKYHLIDLARHTGIHVAGYGSIITDGFISHMRQHFPNVSVTASLEDVREDSARKGSILVTELHQGPGFVTARKIAATEKVIIDLGFFVTDAGIHGDLDPRLYARDDLYISPTPGGLLPIILWLMMERTVESCRRQGSRDSKHCICQ